jgi:hypothetical protein
MRASRVWRGLGLWALILSLGSCADDPVPGVGEEAAECRADRDCAGGACLDGRCVLTGDTGLLDEDEDEDTSSPDIGGDAGDVGDDEDARDAGEDVPLLGQIGDPCDVAEDCASRYCIEGTDGAKVCTGFCDPGNSTCPEGYTCAAVANSGADRTFLCFPEADILCQPCEVNNDCGGLSDLCLEYIDGRFCGRSCEVRGCPEGYECAEISVGDRVSYQCRSQKSYCSGCFDPDGDGYGVGEECLGTDCDEESDQVNGGAAELCDNLDNDCDEAVDEGFDLQVDPAHCGGCGAACQIEGAEAACVEGQCAIGACREGRYDIDGALDNGCEYRCQVSEGGAEACDQLDNDCDGGIDEDFDLTTDVTHCGACGSLCSFPSASARCVEGRCALGECDEFRYDVDGDPSNGCEYLCLPTNGGAEACDNIDNDCDGEIDEDFDLGFDANHCGRCNNVCPEPENGRAACFNGVCGVSECVGLFEDCNQEPTDGCEADLRAPTTCLTCGNRCAFTNGVPGCDEQGCFLAQCEPGWVNADGDPGNGCEYACSPTNGGVEACDTVDNDCDTQIDEGFDLQNDGGNCGACGVQCLTPDASTALCRAGACEVDVCPEERADCNDDYQDGCEVDLLSPQSCRACGNACAYPRATAGCAPEGCFLAQCDELYYDINRDPSDGCEYLCLISNDGVEVCDEQDNDCDGRIDEEFDLNTDLAHCGECGNACAAVPNGVELCDDGTCAIDACDADFLDCNRLYEDGCEAPRLSPSSCLTCGNVCAYANGVPGCGEQGCFLAGCQAGFVDVDGRSSNGCEYACLPTQGGVEVCDSIDNDCDGQIDEGFDLNTDADNCGRCGRECGAPNNAQAICRQGQCAIDGCDANFLDCNNNFNDGCEESAFDVDHCRSCGARCVYPNGVPGCNVQGCFLAACEAGWVNADGNPNNGCELNCTISNGGLEICDERDNDCDGQTDEGFTWTRTCATAASAGPGAR